MDRPCNCDKRYLKKDQTCLFKGFCQRSAVVYELKCRTTGKCYVGKTQRYFKERTAEHVCDVWYVVRSGRKKYGDEWYGNGGYKKADSFAKHFANLCRECRNQNQVRAKMKEIMIPSIIWHGDSIRCMKSACTAKCKLCMQERKEILKRFRKEPEKIINDKTDIFAFCTCNGGFHKFSRKTTLCATLMTRSTQKKVKPSTRKPKRSRRKRKSTASTSSVPFTPACRCSSLGRSTSQSSSDETASPPPVTPVFLFDTNVPGLPYRSPTPNPTNLELAQVRHYLANQPSVEV